MVLDLQHFGALFAQDSGAERGRDPGAHIKHSDPGQRLPHWGCRSGVLSHSESIRGNAEAPMRAP